MTATRIYKILDKLSINGDYSDPKQLLYLGKNVYQSAMAWEVGELKDSYFLTFITKILDRENRK